MRAFISYSSLDASIANEIVDELEKNDIECFIAPRDIRTGHVYAEEIVFGIDTAQVVVLVLTENSNNSQHVLREIERAVSNKVPIISYRNEELKLIPAMEYFLMSNQWLDNPWNGKHEELIEAVKELAKKAVLNEDDSDGNGKEPKSEASKNHAAVSKMKRKKNIWKVVAIIAIALWLVTTCIFMYMRTRNDQGSEGGNATDLSEEKEPLVLQVGDEYKFGRYLGEDITWVVVETEENIATLISKNILCMKGFEGAESGEVFYTVSGETKKADRPFNAVENMEAFGSNDWEKSSLRAWLNSSKNNVEYIGQVPTAKVMCDHDNAYNSEQGFLHDFTEEEIDALILTKISTEFHDWETGKISLKVTEDYVYIPSKEDVKSLEAADIVVYCEPTAAAIADDDSTIYKDYCGWYNLTTGSWWLRDPYEESYSELYCITTGYNAVMFDENVAAVGGIGVRPMIRIDTTKLSAK